MKLVITIDDDIYDDYLKQGAVLPKYGTAIDNLYEALWNGVPLPEHHGRLIDAADLLTDTEQRIFLKAMSREREICQKVDDEYSNDDSKVSLVKVCNSIERKVKKIWE